MKADAEKFKPGVSTMSVIERRFIASSISLRDGNFESSPKITGYAAKVGVLSHDLNGWRERLAPGVFLKSLNRGDDVICNVNHDNSQILGRRKAGTLTLREDFTGLAFMCLLPDTTVGRDTRENVRMGLLSEMSFAFAVDPDGESWDDETLDDDDDVDPEDRGKRCKVRTLRSVRLFDVACVAQPAYPKTDVHVSANPLTMDPTAFAPRNLFPEGIIPAEIRARGLGNFDPQVHDRRRRLTNLFL